MNEIQIEKLISDVGYIKGVMEGIDNKLDSTCEKVESNTKEINANKEWRATIKGMILAYSTIGGIIVGIFTIGVKYALDKYLH